MNIEGHESIANAAGVSLLEQAFETYGQKAPRLAAFNYGNSLTDVSQLVDPVAYADGVKAAKEFIDRTLDELGSTAFVKQADRLLRLADKVSLETLLERLKATLHAALDYYILAENDPRRSELAKLIRTGYRLKAYFKFAHPQAPGEPPPMNTGCFFEIFDRMFTQYYPHEHLDRPEVRPHKEPPEFVIDKAGGARATNQPLQPDLYRYLRDDIEICAGLLSEVDLEWASKTFGPEGVVNDNDLEWNLGLAKLGHALHLVEDFFAHSNFTEHAALIMGQKFIPWKFQYPDNQLFLKRLKAYMPASFADWRQYPGEDYIVTGYFDARDTIISFAHIAEELFGIEASDPVRAVRDTHDTVKEAIEHPEVPLFEAQQIMKDTLEFLDNPQKALEDRHNRVAQKLKDKFEPDLIKLRRPEVTRQVIEQIFKEFPLFRATDPEIKTDIVNYVLMMNRVIAMRKFAISGYKAIKSIMEFIEAPSAWLVDQLADKLHEFIKGAIIFYAKERLYDAIGQDRIGCHSLLAKDHGKEWLYSHMKNCATAVHWYVVKTLTRWSDKDFRTQAAKSPDKKWVNWLELLEFFLRHPKAEQAPTIVKANAAVNIIHVVKDGDMLSNLATRYQPTAMHPDKFTWETIADANFNTYDLPTPQRRDVINQVLRDNKWGYPVHQKPNYAFNPGLRVIIPDQKMEVEVAVPPSDRKWYMDVMDKDWTVFRGFEDPVTKKSMPGKRYHTPVYFKDTKELKAQIARGDCLRRKAEQAYRP